MGLRVAKKQEGWGGGRSRVAMVLGVIAILLSLIQLFGWQVGEYEDPAYRGSGGIGRGAG